MSANDCAGPESLRHADTRIVTSANGAQALRSQNIVVGSQDLEESVLKWEAYAEILMPHGLTREAFAELLVRSRCYKQQSTS